jgi:hypothetical protein
MLRHLKTIFFLILFLFIQGITLAQDARRFNTDPVVFIKELKEKYSEVKDKASFDFFEKFHNDWLNGRYNPEQQRNLISMSNKMLDQGMTLTPYFELFYNDYTQSLESKFNKNLLTQWLNIANQLVSKSNKDYLEFLSMTKSLFTENKLHQQGTKYWQFDSTEYDLKMIKGRVAIEFKDVLLKGIATNDTVEIKTSGICYLTEGLWEGTKGETSLARSYPGENAKVTFKKFKIELKNYRYDIDTVSLHFPRFFDKPIKGTYKEEIRDFFTEGNMLASKFPQFTSFDNQLKINGIVGKNSVFTGGLTLLGRTIQTTTADGKPSIIDIYFKNEKKVSLKSKGFQIKNGVALSTKTEFSMFLDSSKKIFHPSVDVVFNYQQNRLKINKGEDGLQRGVFQNDFHNMNIDVQTVSWKIDEPFVDFDNYNDEKPAFFESNDFFRKIYYDRIQGALNANPIEKIHAFYMRMPPDPAVENLEKELKRLSLQNPQNKEQIANVSKRLVELNKARRAKFITPERKKFALKDYCEVWNCNPQAIQHAFIDLHDDGFLIYDFEKDSAVITEKLFNYIIMNKKGKDYDVIKLSSVIAARPNATLNLLSNELNIEGVAAFNFSDSQSVYVLPKEQQVRLTKNRQLEFGGKVSAGRFEFFGEKFSFDYQKFNVYFEVIDSMRMYFPDESGVRLRPIKSVFRNIGGTLYIDKPNNKSGNIDYPEYPIFTSNRGGDILYDKPSIHGGQYLAETFKFTVDPFTIDSLDNFTIDGLTFDGTFYSADIFPVFKHKVYIQPDYSLGFVYTLPGGGLPMYKGKGHGDMTLNLSEVGFYGQTGNIKYETSLTQFNRILMLPDSTMGPINTYDLKESTLYAEAHAKDAQLRWIPYQDKYKITTEKWPTRTFKDAHAFTGTTTQSPSKLLGDGLLKWDLAEFRSREMHLQPKQSVAQQASLIIFTQDTTKMAFASDNINGSMNFQTRIGDFRSNIAGQITKFPFNMYQTNLSDYLWKMDAYTIEANVGPSMGGVQPDFMSTHYRQDSLRFEGRKGLYDLREYTLNVSQIPHIDFADSRLFLNDGKVLIRKEANMDTLYKARIVANRIDTFHNITNVTAKLFGKYAIGGNGDYKYVNKLGKKQDVHFDSMVVVTDKKLHAFGSISEESGFTLDTKIAFKGKAHLISAQRDVRFRGLIKTQHTFDFMRESAWCKFDGDVNPVDVVIPMNPPQNASGARMFVGLHVAKDSSHIYPVFNSTKRRLSDNDVTQDTGILYWDHEKQSFFAGSKKRLKENDLSGNFIQFNEADHSIHAEGPMDFGVESNNVKFRSVGTADLKPGDSAFQFNISMLMDFPLHADFKKRMAEMFVGEGMGNVDINNDLFRRHIHQLIDDKSLRKDVLRNMEQRGQIKGNLNLLGGKDETNYNFIFSDAKFKWDSKAKGMYSDGTITLVSLFGTPLNKSINAVIYMESKRGAEKMHIYLDDGTNKVYFFLQSYRVSIYTNDEKLLEIMSKTNSKVKPRDFGVSTTGERTVDRFLKKIGMD